VIKEFRDFILRGNLVDLAVAVVIGTAFGVLVKSLTDNMITPVLALIGGKPDFSDLVFEISGTEFRYGAFLTDLIGFLIIAAVIFFLVVKPVNTLLDRARRGDTEDEAPDPQIVVLEEIRDLLKAR
jgi:large conductance mechanosensitive channel